MVEVWIERMAANDGWWLRVEKLEGAGSKAIALRNWRSASVAADTEEVSLQLALLGLVRSGAAHVDDVGRFVLPVSLAKPAE